VPSFLLESSGRRRRGAPPSSSGSISSASSNGPPALNASLSNGLDSISSKNAHSKLRMFFFLENLDFLLMIYSWRDWS
jgi:hypothetical protein